MNVRLLQPSKSKVLSMVATVLTLLITVGIASATPVVYFGENLYPNRNVSGDPVTARNAFLANLKDPENLDLEGRLASLAPHSFMTPIGTSSNEINLVTFGSNLGGGICDGTNDEVGHLPCNRGEFATSGMHYYLTGYPFFVAFETPISAFGFYATDLGDSNNQFLVVATSAIDGSRITLTIPSGNKPDGSLLFWGFVDTDNSYIRLDFELNRNTIDTFGIDDMWFGDAGHLVQTTPVPEPATMLLFGAGLAGLAVYRRFRMFC